ncbi:hypothetical protein GGR57DRAFT_503005 [Xylariaceae sp. FL1272]|nr:hypothetical protein GGR57DRAFT_503005 [Xylariaceae sp. FL1272]
MRTLIIISTIIAAVTRPTGASTDPRICGEFTVTFLGSYINRPYVSFNVSAPDNYVEGVRGFPNIECKEISLLDAETPPNDTEFTSCTADNPPVLEAKVTYPYTVYVRHAQTDSSGMIVVSGESPFEVRNPPEFGVPVTDIEELCV